MTHRRTLFSRIAKSAASAAVAALAALAPQRAEALVIDVVGPGGGFFQSFGPPLPGANAGFLQADLLNIMNAAGDYWESVLDSATPRTVTIQAGFTNQLGTNTLAAALGGHPQAFGFIGFRSSVNWFNDPTPLDHSEFATFTETFADLGGGLINTTRVFSDPNAAALGRIDAFDTALHEIGHVLGLTTPFGAIQGNNPIEIEDPLPFAGSLIPSINGHLALLDSVMDPAGSLNERTLLSDADILAVAQAGGFTRVTLRATQLIDEPPAALALLAALAALLAARLARGRRQASTAAFRGAAA